MVSLRVSQPIEEEEISLLDKFIVKYSGTYEFSIPAYKTMLLKIFDNRINNQECSASS
jgi:hypothetical protein